MNLFFKVLMALLGSLLSARFAPLNLKLIMIVVIALTFLFLAARHIDYQSNASLRYWQFDGKCFSLHGTVQIAKDRLQCVSFGKVVMEEVF